MATDAPPSFTLEAVMTALDEDDAVDWLARWRAAPSGLRTLMESDIAVAAVVRSRSDSTCRIERRRFLDIVSGSGI